MSVFTGNISDMLNLKMFYYIVTNLFMLKILSIIFLTGFIFLSPVFAAPSLDEVNQKICSRFEEDMSRLAAIMEEVRRRKGITETRVAFGGIDDAIKSADYQITFAAEAIAFQRAQKYSTANQLRSQLEVLKGKVLRAKAQVGRALE